MAKLIIKELLKAMDITSAEVAKRMGISPTALSLAINGNPTVETLNKIADAVGVPVTDLFEQPGTSRLVCPHCGKPIEIILR